MFPSIAVPLSASCSVARKEARRLPVGPSSGVQSAADSMGSSSGTASRATKSEFHSISAPSRRASKACAIVST